jgi:hypothetical protein
MKMDKKIKMGLFGVIGSLVLVNLQILFSYIVEIHFKKVTKKGRF